MTSDPTVVIVEVELRGVPRRLTWTEAGLGGDAEATERLARVPERATDPVSFLRNVRLVFGEHVITHMGPAAPGTDLRLSLSR